MICPWMHSSWSFWYVLLLIVFLKVSAHWRLLNFFCWVRMLFFRVISFFLICDWLPENYIHIHMCVCVCVCVCVCFSACVCEWKINQLDAIPKNCVHSINTYTLQDRISNIIANYNIRSIECFLLQLQLLWAGHIIQMIDDRIPHLYETSFRKQRC